MKHVTAALNIVNQFEVVETMDTQFGVIHPEGSFWRFGNLSTEVQSFAITKSRVDRTFPND